MKLIFLFSKCNHNYSEYNYFLEITIIYVIIIKLKNILRKDYRFLNKVYDYYCINSSIDVHCLRQTTII